MFLSQECLSLTSPTPSPVLIVPPQSVLLCRARVGCSSVHAAPASGAMERASDGPPASPPPLCPCSQASLRIQWPRDSSCSSLTNGLHFPAPSWNCSDKSVTPSCRNQGYPTFLILQSLTLTARTICSILQCNTSRA